MNQLDVVRQTERHATFGKKLTNVSSHKTNMMKSHDVLELMVALLVLCGRLHQPRCCSCSNCNHLFTVLSRPLPYARITSLRLGSPFPVSDRQEPRDSVITRRAQFSSLAQLVGRFEQPRQVAPMLVTSARFLSRCLQSDCI